MPVFILRRWQMPALLLGVMVLAVIGFVAYRQLSNQPILGGQSQGQTLQCSPQPCLDINNYTLWISNVSEASGIVRMQASFRNASDATHASPEDLQLIDAKKQTWNAVQDLPGCSRWERTEFNKGARFGPITVCFRPTSTEPPLTLRWSPDFGFLCCEADIRVK